MHLVLGMRRMVGLAVGWWFRISILRMSECRASRENTCRRRTFDEKTSAIFRTCHCLSPGAGGMPRTISRNALASGSLQNRDNQTRARTE